MNTVIKRFNPKANATFTRRLVLTAHALDRKFTPGELLDLRAQAGQHLTADMFVTVRADAALLGEVVLNYDLYSVEQLTFAQRLRHCLRMFKATVFDYIGISTGIVIIKR